MIFAGLFTIVLGIGTIMAFVERDAPISKKLASILAGVGGIIVLIGLIVLIAGIMQ